MKEHEIAQILMILFIIFILLLLVAGFGKYGWIVKVCDVVEYRNMTNEEDCRSYSIKLEKTK